MMAPRFLIYKAASVIQQNSQHLFFVQFFQKMLIETTGNWELLTIWKTILEPIRG